MSTWRSSDSDNTFVRGLLWESFPEYRQVIIEVEEEQRSFTDASEDVSMYRTLTEVFTVKAFEVLFAPGELDPDLAQRCSAVIEELLGSGRPDVLDLAGARVIDYLLGWGDPWLRFKPFAGALLIQAVQKARKYYTGPF